MDPDAITADLKAAKAKRDHIHENYDNIRAGFGEKWRPWLLKYKALLATQAQTDQQRRAKMNLANPSFVLRNYLLQEAIEKAESGDFQGVERLLERAKRPFDEPQEGATCAVKPSWAFDLCVSCSS